MKLAEHEDLAVERGDENLYDYWHGYWIIAQIVHALASLTIMGQSFMHGEEARLDFWNNIVAPLAVAAIVGVWGWAVGKRTAQRRVEAAPRRYIKELDQLIARALREGEDKAIINARAIVAARNNLRSSLVSISRSLNSEIDQLARDIGQRTASVLPPSSPSQNGDDVSIKQAYETIQVLARVWPTKRAEIQYEIRKLLAELGLGVAPLAEEGTGPA
jgi:hypothetical protein